MREGLPLKLSWWGDPSEWIEHGGAAVPRMTPYEDPFWLCTQHTVTPVVVLGMTWTSLSCKAKISEKVGKIVTQQIVVPSDSNIMLTEWTDHQMHDCMCALNQSQTQRLCRERVQHIIVYYLSYTYYIYIHMLIIYYRSTSKLEHTFIICRIKSAPGSRSHPCGFEDGNEVKLAPTSGAQAFIQYKSWKLIES